MGIDMHNQVKDGAAEDTGGNKFLLLYGSGKRIGSVLRALHVWRSLRYLKCFNNFLNLLGTFLEHQMGACYTLCCHTDEKEEKNAILW